MGTQPSGWTFSFAGYMARYSFAFPHGDPKFFSIAFGTNDVVGQSSASNIEPTYTAALSTIIASVHSYNPNIIILLGVPTQGAGQDGWGIAYGSSSPYQSWKQFRRKEQDFARYMLNTWDTSANNAAKVYVVPTYLVVDPMEGYGNYTTSCGFRSLDSKLGQTFCHGDNGVHPEGIGYEQLGREWAAIIQWLRP